MTGYYCKVCGVSCDETDYYNNGDYVCFEHRTPWLENTDKDEHRGEN